MKVAVSFDASEFERDLALLAEAAERFPEIGDGLVELFEAGEQMIVVEMDPLTAPLAGELIVRLNPSDRLRVLLAAVWARNGELGLIEHSQSPEVAG
ncbi:hypothetical protein [Bosea thiooxidans]|uniref:hypothetical protein n=1 Tax=Bosea thiooxidans TaxID=53254 RepID=UPI0011178030|nr:hypothetical protein [Bosea thiooxidans]